MKKLSIAIFCLIATLTANATTTVAVASGSWNEATIWNNGIPVCGTDTIIIPAGIQVDITSTIDHSACPDSMLIIVSGTLQFQNGKKLKLPCNSDVVVMAGGSMGVGSGGGNSTYLEMCGTQYWNASQGNLSGPQSLCDGPCPGSLLPIELLFFNAELNDNRHVELNWVTVTEISNDYFTIERSVDGVSWHEVLQVDGVGNSNYQISYEEIDESPLYGGSYYRLKQTDFNGAFTYSSIISIYRNSGSGLLVYPNPINTGGEMLVDLNQLVITFPDLKERSIDVRVYTVDGKIMYATSVDLTKTKQLFIPIGSNFAPGMYVVSTDYLETKFIVN